MFSDEEGCGNSEENRFLDEVLGAYFLKILNKLTIKTTTTNPSNHAFQYLFMKLKEKSVVQNFFTIFILRLDKMGLRHMKEYGVEKFLNIPYVFPLFLP